MAAPATVTETPLLGLGFSQMENFKSPVNALPLATKVSLTLIFFILLAKWCMFHVNP